MPDMPVEWISRIGALWKRWGVGVRVGGQRGRTEVGCGHARGWTEVGLRDWREVGVGVGRWMCVERVWGVLPLGP